MVSIEYMASVEELTTKFDAFILDLWGVVHDGKQLYPGTLDCLKQLRKAGKKITFLSNAPRRAHVVQTALAGMGVDASLYDTIITSGEAAFRHLEHPEKSFFKPRGHNYLYIGLERDRQILDGLHYTEVKHAEQAQFVLLSHSFEDNQPLSMFASTFEECAALHLPMLCINPDMEVVRITGERVYCAGELARDYHMRGGEVVYFGKPHRTVYELTLATFSNIDHSRIVAIGDSLNTDILGGNRTGIATALVAGGILKATLGAASEPGYTQKCEALFKEKEIAPQFVLPAFCY